MKKYRVEVTISKTCEVEIEIERPDDWDPTDFQEDIDSGCYRVGPDLKPGEDNVAEHDDQATINYVAEWNNEDWQIEYVDKITPIK